jgi:hypothetical protein
VFVLEFIGLCVGCAACLLGPTVYERYRRWAQERERRAIARESRLLPEAIARDAASHL